MLFLVLLILIGYYLTLTRSTGFYWVLFGVHSRAALHQVLWFDLPFEYVVPSVTEFFIATTKRRGRCRIMSGRSPFFCLLTGRLLSRSMSVLLLQSLLLLFACRISFSNKKQKQKQVRNCRNCWGSLLRCGRSPAHNRPEKRGLPSFVQGLTEFLLGRNRSFRFLLCLFFPRFFLLLAFAKLYWASTWAEWILHAISGFYRVLLGFTGFYWVLLGFTGFPWVLLGFSGFYMVLLGFTGFHQDSLSFIGFTRFN